MTRKWLLGVGIGLLATAALVTVGVIGYNIGERHDSRLVVTSAESLDGRIVVDHDHWGPGPGFLVFPLVIAGVVLLLASRRRHGWCDPGYYGRRVGPGYGYWHGYGDPYGAPEPGSERPRGEVREPGGAPPPAADDDAGPPPPSWP